MKKSICVLAALLFILLSFYSPQLYPASATEQTYAYLSSNGVYFYASDDERSELFLLPKTYYVQVLKRGDIFTKVEYCKDSPPFKKLTGYCKTNELEFIQYTPATPYPTVQFTVEYFVQGGLENDPLLTPIPLQCYFYGEYAVGSKKYAYVLRGEEFVYVPLPENFSYPLNTEHQSQLPPAENSSLEDSVEQSADGGQIAVLILLALLIPVLAALVLKSPKRPVFEVEE